MSAVLLMSVLAVPVVASAPSGPMLEPNADSGLHVDPLGKTKIYCLVGWTLPPTGGFTAGNFLDAMQPAPAGYERRIYHNTTLDNSELHGDDIVSTGDVMQLRSLADDRIVDSLTIVIRGDVLGIGEMNICQVDAVRDLIGTTDINTVYQWAADMNWDGQILGDGRINNDDLLAAAEILTALDGVNGETTTTVAPASMTPALTVLPDEEAEQGDLIRVRIDNNAFGTEALIDVDPTLLRYEGHVGLGTEDHLVLVPADMNTDYSYSEYTYTVLAKPGTTIPFTLTNVVVRASGQSTEPMSVEHDPWTTVQVGGNGLSFSPEACPEVTGPDAAYVGEELEIQVVVPADCTDFMARVSTTGLQFQEVSAPDGAADNCTASMIEWTGGSRVLTYKYKVTAYAGQPVKFVISDSIAYLTKYEASIAGGQTSWSARADAGLSYPMITLRQPANGSLQASLLPATSKPTPTPAPTSLVPAPVPSQSATAAPTAEPSFSTTGSDVSFRAYAKGRYVYLTAAAQSGYVLSSVTASSGGQTMTYNRKDLLSGTGRFGVDGRFFVLGKSATKAELRFTVPALDVVISANFITQAEADAQDEASPSPSPLESPSESPSPSPSPSPSESPSASPSPSESPTPSPSPSESPSASPSPSETLTPSPSPSGTMTFPPTRTPSPTEPPISYNFDLSGTGLHVAATSLGMPFISGSSLRATKEGTYVQDFLSMIEPPENGTLQVVTEDGRDVPISALVATGQVLEARSAGGTLLDHAYIVVKGDVIGNGVANVAQMTMVADAVLGRRTLTGLKKEAADMNENSRIDIGDLVSMAGILNER